MANRSSALSRTVPLIAGAALALGQATSALAETIEVFDLPIQTTPREYLLIGSLVLLGVALAARIYRRRHTEDPMPEGPDLRWWRNS